MLEERQAGKTAITLILDGEENGPPRFTPWVESEPGRMGRVASIPPGMTVEQAERRCGELLAEMPKAKGARVRGGDSTGSPIVLPPGNEQTLADLGISKRQSSEWQALAAKLGDEFESALAEQEIPTTNGVLNHRAQGTGQNEPCTTDRANCDQCGWPENGQILLPKLLPNKSRLAACCPDFRDWIRL
jgi:hypothetical protein